MNAREPRLPSDSTAAWSAVALVGLLMVATLLHDRPPAPVGRDASPTAFSAERAVAALSRVLGDGTPHPTGSVANKEVRERLVAELERIGYVAEVRERFVCAADGTCATVANVFTKLSGSGSTPGVLLVTHYDSVAAGPGASDAGSGVAALLEVARALQAQSRLPRDVWFLFTDGEEVGLHGAEAFVKEPEFEQIGIAINFEARGTTGPSRLIETSKGNAGLIAQLRASVSDPTADSLTYEGYKLLPYDTDLTVFQRTGIPSMGFAFAGGAARYHTLRDDLEHLDRGSVQGHGDYALGLAREFATHGVQASDHDVVFFNLFGTLLVWSETRNLGLLALGLGGLLALLVRLRRGSYMRWSQFSFATLACIGLVVGCLLLGIGLRSLLAALGALPGQWTAQETQLVTAFVLLPIAVLALLAGAITRRWGPHALGAASFLPFAGIATATVLELPGGSFVGLPPLLVGAVVANIWPERPVIWAGALAAAATPVFFGMGVAGYGGLGQAALAGTPMVLALGLFPLIVALSSLARAGRAIGVLALLGCLVATVMAVLSPAFTRDTPMVTQLVFISRPEDAKLYAYAGASMPPALAAAGSFESQPRQVLPWLPVPLFVGHDGPKLKEPTLELLEDASTPEGRRLELHLRSMRGASQGSIWLEPTAGLLGGKVQGVALPKPAPSEKIGRNTKDAWRLLNVRQLSGEGARFSIELSKRDAVQIHFYDASFGLPADQKAVADAREPHVAPIHMGDLTLSWSVLNVPAWEQVPPSTPPAITAQ